MAKRAGRGTEGARGLKVLRAIWRTTWLLCGALAVLLASIWVIATPGPSLASSGSILIVAPHPDDDLLYGAGVEANALAAGKSVKVVYMTNGDLGSGRDLGLQREGEAVAGQSVLGIPESDLIFLGYPDGYLLNLLQDYPNPTDALVTGYGLSTTYGARGLGGSDYHTYHFGAPALYNAADVLQDLTTIIETYKPDDVYTTSEFDVHHDHSSTYYFVRSAIMQAMAADATYSPKLHKTIVHWANDDVWPEPMDPQVDQAEIPGLSSTGLVWADRESLKVPAAMQSTDYSTNPKYLAIAQHVSQDGTAGFLGDFIHADEIFWLDNLSNHAPVANAGLDQAVDTGAAVTLDGTASSDADGDALTYEWSQTAGPTVTLSSTTAAKPTFTAPDSPISLSFQLIVFDGKVQSVADTVTIAVSDPVDRVNIASLATVTASSENASSGQLAVKAVDGVVDGYPGDYTKEWATVGGGAGSWLRLAWSTPQSVSKIVLYDRPNLNDQITAATLRFSDGSTISTGALNNDGSAVTITFAAKIVTSVELDINSVKATGTSIGLSEIEVWAASTPPANRAPTAKAGLDQTVPSGAAVTLDGSGSVDPDGDALTYQWAQTSGPGVTLSSATSAKPTFTAPTSAASLTFQLVVSDGQASSAADVIVVTVQAPGDTANVASLATVTASSEDASYGQQAIKAVDGVVDGYPGDYTKEWATVGEGAGSWLKLVWPTPQTVSKIVLYDRPNLNDQITAATIKFSDGTTLTTGALNNDGTAVALTFAARTVTSVELDIDGVSNSTVSVGLSEIEVWASSTPPANHIPVANAGPAQTVASAAPVTLDGTGSSDADGDALTYLWTQTAGPAVTLSSSTVAKPTFTAPAGATSLTFSLVVSDGKASSPASSVVVTVQAPANHIPVANAGPAQTVASAAPVTLDGTGSSDADGDALTYLWTQTAGPAVTLSSSTVAKPTFTAPAGATSLTFSLVVSDGKASSPASSVVVTVQAPANHIPVANAGPAQTVASAAPVTLDGTGSSDADGDALTYLWTQTAGPAVTLSSSTVAKPTFTAPAGATSLTFSLVVSDGKASSPASSVVVTVQAPANHIPVANAGPAQTVASAAPVTLDGTGSSDADGDALTYLWTQTAGPAVTLSSSTVAKPTFTAPAGATSLTFSLVVSDGKASSPASSVVVTVQAPAGLVNVASLATVTASSQTTSTGQLAIKAVDGIVSGYPGDYTKEWATNGGKAGSWLKLVWATPQTVSKIVLYDRPNLNDQITAATIKFSDGTTLTTGALNNDGTALTITFAAKTITSIELDVTSVKSTTANIGLSEIEVWAG